MAPVPLVPRLVTRNREPLLLRRLAVTKTMVWEYRKIDLNDVPRRGLDVDVLNQLGREGWELVAMTANGIACLKRAAAASRTTPKHAGERSAP